MPIPIKSGFQILTSAPQPGQSTFNQGIPATSSAKEVLSIMIYSPNLQILLSMDNANSDADCTYETSVTQGFTFSSTQSVSISSEVGVSIEIVTAKVTTTFTLSFTEEWNTSTTKTMSFTCPAGKSAFVYQGTLMARVMKFDPSANTYTWYTAESKALSQVLVTSRTPIGIAPSNAVTITSQQAA